MKYPVIPLDIVASQQIQYIPIGKKYQYKPGQYTSYHRLSHRQIPRENYQLSQYVSDIATIENFLLERNGYKPFTWLYNGRSYICTSYTIDYVFSNKGNITMVWEQFAEP